jgi:hypothetical protein
MPTSGAPPEARGGKREVAPEQHVLRNTLSEQELRLSEPRRNLSRIPSLKVFGRARDILQEKRTAAANLDAGDNASRPSVHCNVAVDAGFGPKSEAGQGPDAETRRRADDTRRRRRRRGSRAVSWVACYPEHAEGSTRLHPRAVTKKEEQEKAAKKERMGKEQEDKSGTPAAKQVWKAEKTDEVEALKEKVSAQRKEARERAEARQQLVQGRRLAGSIKTATVSQEPRRDGNAEEEEEEEKECSLLFKKPAAASPRSQAGVIAGKAAVFIRLKEAELEASRRTLSAAQDTQDPVVTNVCSSAEGAQADVEESSPKKHGFSSQLEEEAWAWARQLSEPALIVSQSDARRTWNEATRDVTQVNGEGERVAEREKKKEKKEETVINEMAEAPRNLGVSERERERERGRERLSSVALGEAEHAAAAIWQRQAEIEAAQAAAPPPVHAWAHQFEPAPGHNVIYTEDSAAVRGGRGRRGRGRERERGGRVYIEKSGASRGVEADMMLEASHAASPLPNEKLLLDQLENLIKTHSNAIRTHSNAPLAGKSAEQAAALARESLDLVPHASMQEESLDAAALAWDVTSHANRLEDLFMNARFQALILKCTD